MHSPSPVALVAEEFPQPIPVYPEQHGGRRDQQWEKEKSRKMQKKEGRMNGGQHFCASTNSLAHLLSLSLERSALAQWGTQRAKEREAQGGGRKERCSSLTWFVHLGRHDRVAMETGGWWEGRVANDIAGWFLHPAIKGSAGESNDCVTYVTLKNPLTGIQYGKEKRQTYTVSHKISYSVLTGQINMQCCITQKGLSFNTKTSHALI